MQYTRKELIEAITKAITYMKKSGAGCYTFKLNNRLAICVGWCDGYDPADIDLIHDENDPTWCLNAGIKVHTSDSMRTDYEYINSPFYRSGDVWSTDVSLSPDEDIEELADYLLREYESMKKLDIAEDGEIMNYESPDDYYKKNEVK